MGTTIRQTGSETGFDTIGTSQQRPKLASFAHQSVPCRDLEEVLGAVVRVDTPTSISALASTEYPHVVRAL